MKIRSLLLVICMLVVPALAMFSHLIPADLRAAVRRSVASATSGWLVTPAEAGTVGQSQTLPAEPVPQTVSGIPRPAVEEKPVSTKPLVAALAPTTAVSTAGATGSPSADVRSVGNAAPHAAPMEPASPPLVAQLADRTRQVRDQQAREQQRFDVQLKSLGAVSIDCQPMPGPDGLYTCSCRVPVDATGQLQRVFQAVGHDPGSASAGLVEQVTAWRQRMASPSSPASHGATADAVGPPPAARFR